MEFEQLTDDDKVSFVRKTISDFQGGERLKVAKERRDYYKTENPDIAERRKMYAGAMEQGDTIRAVAKENKFASNEKIASSFFRDITDAKVQYIAGEGADVTPTQDDEAASALIRTVGDALGNSLKRVEQESLTDALIYSTAYAYMQVIDGKIKVQHFPYCEIVPFYDRYGSLANVLRYYKQQGIEYAEYHTPATVYSFERNEKSRESKGWRYVGETPQIITARIYGDGKAEITGGKAWPRLPWFEMQHNNDKTSSLTNAAKSMIRCYDLTASDFANNLIDIQDIFVSMKDSGGYGSGLEYGEMLDLLKTFKVSEQELNMQTVEVPYQARQVFLDMLQRNIYAALRGVDVGRISGGNLTNTAIRALYSDIDLWADLAEWHLSDWVESVYDLAAWYMGVQLPPLKVSFTRRAIFDDVAQMDALARQKGIISDMTIYENHPLVTDAAAEAERVANMEIDEAYQLGAPMQQEPFSGAE